MHDCDKKIIQRPVGDNAELPGIHPILQRIYRARGICSVDQLELSLKKLPPPDLLSGMADMVEYLLDAIKTQKKILIIADYDADGASSCAVAVRGLSLLGAMEPEFIVPNRFEYGYGLTPEIVALAKVRQPDILLTVDNGISSIDGVAAAKQAGMTVLLTDHHLPGQELPAADAIVNPNLPDDPFPSRALAGVGVMFYVLIGLRARLQELGFFQHKKAPNLGQLLDLVALGTVADVVPLDYINRILVQQGLLRIRAGQAHAGINALIEQSGRKRQMLGSSDLGFAIGPRLNAAGRMDDMALGIHCLLTDDPERAKTIALQLDELNQSRKQLESRMKNEAFEILNQMRVFEQNRLPSGVCLFDENWHEGIIGILASRIKDRLHRPVIAFAPAEIDAAMIKGSARSIAGLHIRDVLSELAARHPQVLQKFGGHAMAAGLSIKRSDYPFFQLVFDEIVAQKLETLDLQQVIYSDGELAESDITVPFAELLHRSGPWGQAFPEPVFNGVFDVIQARVVGQYHLKLVLRYPFSNRLIDAIAFHLQQVEQWLGVRVLHTVYSLDVNEYRGRRDVQLRVQYLEKRQ